VHNFGKDENELGGNAIFLSLISYYWFLCYLKFQVQAITRKTTYTANLRIKKSTISFINSYPYICILKSEIENKKTKEDITIRTNWEKKLFFQWQQRV